MEHSSHRETERLRQLLSTGTVSPTDFREALSKVSARERDGWLDRVFGIDELTDDGSDLPRGCVPYLPSSVDTILHMVDLAKVQATDVFVDIGSGLGRTMALTHFLTGAGAIGLEIQAELVHASRSLAARLNAPRIAVIQGDAAELARHLLVGSVFFLYCPFSGERLDRVLDDLGMIAQTRPIRVCTVDLPLPPRSWLAPVARAGSLAVHQSLC